MANAKNRTSRSRSKPLSGKRTTTSKSDAIALLKADHREVEGWFAQYEKARSEDKKSELARKICGALKIHTRIEEELFYPAFLDATDDKALHHEAEIEHDAAKKLIADIEASGPDDEYYDANVKVLSEMIKHHVKEEEQPGGLFSEARKSGMDLQAIGAQLQARKNELLNGSRHEQPRRGRSASRDRSSGMDEQVERV